MCQCSRKSHLASLWDELLSLCHLHLHNEGWEISLSHQLMKTVLTKVSIFIAEWSHIVRSQIWTRKRAWSLRRITESLSQDIVVSHGLCLIFRTEMRTLTFGGEGTKSWASQGSHMLSACSQRQHVSSPNLAPTRMWKSISKYVGMWWPSRKTRNEVVLINSGASTSKNCLSRGQTSFEGLKGFDEAHAVISKKVLRFIEAPEPSFSTASLSGVQKLPSFATRKKFMDPVSTVPGGFDRHAVADNPLVKTGGPDDKQTAERQANHHSDLSRWGSTDILLMMKPFKPVKTILPFADCE